MNANVDIARLFDYQRFENNGHLARLIAQSEERVDGRRELDEDSLEVWAAGEPEIMKNHDALRRKKDD